VAKAISPVVVVVVCTCSDGGVASISNTAGCSALYSYILPHNLSREAAVNFPRNGNVAIAMNIRILSWGGLASASCEVKKTISVGCFPAPSFLQRNFNHCAFSNVSRSVSIAWTKIYFSKFIAVCAGKLRCLFREQYLIGYLTVIWSSGSIAAKAINLKLIFCRCVVFNRPNAQRVREFRFLHSRWDQLQRLHYYSPKVHFAVSEFRYFFPNLHRCTWSRLFTDILMLPTVPATVTIK